jgi:hypothetical protein
VTDFDGARRTAGEIARRGQARVTPTLRFPDGQGHELTGHMIGIGTPELHGGYPDACIDSALLRVRAPDRLVAFPGGKGSVAVRHTLRV